jgi:phenylpyruvate tautomerase PptA (4-oxalocrotonate tautomerase family)
MDMVRNSNEVELQESGGLNRRTVLMSAAAAAGAIGGVSVVQAESVAPGNFGAPLVEAHFPAGILTLEQKAAMIKGMTEVVSSAMKLPPDPARKSFVQIFETAEGGFGVDGRVFVPRGR